MVVRFFIQKPGGTTDRHVHDSLKRKQFARPHCLEFMYTLPELDGMDSAPQQWYAAPCLWRTQNSKKHSSKLRVQINGASLAALGAPATVLRQYRDGRRRYNPSSSRTIRRFTQTFQRLDVYKAKHADGELIRPQPMS